MYYMDVDGRQCLLSNRSIRMNQSVGLILGSVDWISTTTTKRIRKKEMCVCVFLKMKIILNCDILHHEFIIRK